MVKVAKFGGSSLSDEQQFAKVKEIVQSDSERSIIVVSALGKREDDDNKITDLLYILHAHIQHGVEVASIWQQIESRFLSIEANLAVDAKMNEELAFIQKQLHKKTSLDYLVSRGEYLTAKLMSSYLGFTFIDAKDVIVFQFDGKIDGQETSQRLKNQINKQSVVIPGFYGSYSSGQIKLMSRGGSDITGSVVAQVTQASIYENWTDVSGILMADPRIIENPATIEQITYAELRELSYMGANVIHESTIFPVQEVGIPINIRNTNQPLDAGTTISNHLDTSPYPITGIAGKQDFLGIIIYKMKMSDEIGFMSKVMAIFEKFNLSIEHVPTGLDNVEVIVHSEAVEILLPELLNELENTLSPDSIEVVHDITLLAIVGRQMKGVTGLVGQIFTTLGAAEINVSLLSQSTRELTLIIGIANKDYEKAIKALYGKLVKTC